MRLTLEELLSTPQVQNSSRRCANSPRNLRVAIQAPSPPPPTVSTCHSQSGQRNRSQLVPTLEIEDLGRQDSTNPDSFCSTIDHGECTFAEGHRVAGCSPSPTN